MNDAASTEDWLGRTHRDEDEVTLGAVRRLAATLDQEPTVFRRGSEMPESWYAILFAPVAPESTLAPDGHLLTGDFLPPLHGARRRRNMQAYRLWFLHQPIEKGLLSHRWRDRQLRNGPLDVDKALLPGAASRTGGQVLAQVRRRLSRTLQGEQTAVDVVAVHGFSCSSGGAS